MKLAPALVAIGSLALLSACSTVGSSNEAESSTQWKKVTRIVNGNAVTYQVPVNQKVPNDVNTRPWVTDYGTGKAVPATAAAAPAPTSAHANAAEVAQAGSSAAAESSAVSEEAEIALGRAEIAVQDAQTRLETARTALNRARQAAHAGDSASTVKFANTAISISRADH